MAADHGGLAYRLTAMADTPDARVRRNPPWAEEELILALDMYLRLGLLDSNHAEVVELSELLNGLTLHPDRPDADRFRNPNGVSLKLANFAAIDPAYPGKGMSSGGKRDAQIWTEFHGDEDAVSQAAARIRQSLPWREPQRLPLATPAVRRRPLEQLHTRRYTIRLSRTTTTGQRRELVLVHDFAKHLQDRGHRVCQHDYPIETADGALTCDLFDETINALYEAKSNTSRKAIRMAVGKLLDYRRFEDADVLLVALLPRRPPPDLCAFLASCAVSLVWRAGDHFDTDTSHLFTQAQ